MEIHLWLIQKCERNSCKSCTKAMMKHVLKLSDLHVVDVYMTLLFVHLVLYFGGFGLDNFLHAVDD